MAADLTFKMKITGFWADAKARHFKERLLSAKKPAMRSYPAFPGVLSQLQQSTVRMKRRASSMVAATKIHISEFPSTLFLQFKLRRLGLLN